jgi:hypothetical protein
VTRGAVFSGGKTKIARHVAELEPEASTRATSWHRLDSPIPECTRSLSFGTSPQHSSLRSIGSSGWGTPFRSGVQNGRPEKPRSRLRDGSHSGEIALRCAIEGAVYGWEGAAPQPRSCERLAETRGEDRSASLPAAHACFDSDSDAKSAAPKANLANHPSQNCAYARIPTRSARRANEFVFTIRRYLAGLPDRACAPAGLVFWSAFSCCHDLPACPWSVRVRTQIVTSVGISARIPSSRRAFDGGLISCSRLARPRAR